MKKRQSPGAFSFYFFEGKLCFNAAPSFSYRLLVLSRSLTKDQSGDRYCLQQNTSACLPGRENGKPV
jgi:hypothetical protein